MKELDDSTLRLARHLAEKEAGLMKQRYVRVWVIWVGGDKETFAKWAAEHNIKDLRLAVIAADDETLNPWRINKRVGSTTVLLDRTRPLATLIDLEKADLTLFEKKADEHFRCKGD
ncbi:MAG: hypothetical protein HY000_16750 [Planctomycetes bacterium]|nr:hypothetical protein [Planctomycetia bacterium]MBI3464683.1 hypothetical protein [Planctomycetota bacterium]